MWCVTNMLPIPIMPNGIGSMAFFHALRPQDLDRANAVVGPGGCRVATALLPFFRGLRRLLHGTFVRQSRLEREFQTPRHAIRCVTEVLALSLVVAPWIYAVVCQRLKTGLTQRWCSRSRRERREYDRLCVQWGGLQRKG